MTSAVVVVESYLCKCANGIQFVLSREPTHPKDPAELLRRRVQNERTRPAQSEDAKSGLHEGPGGYGIPQKQNCIVNFFW